MYRGFKPSEMMAMALSPPQSVNVAKNLLLRPLRRPADAHLPDHDIERTLPPFPAMDDNGVRNRGQGTSNPEANTNTSSDTTFTLTPTSSAESGFVEGL